MLYLFRVNDNIIPKATLLPNPFECIADFQEDIISCWSYAHTPDIDPHSPPSWLPFLQDKYRILLTKTFMNSRKHIILPIYVTQDQFHIQAHVLSLIHALLTFEEYKLCGIDFHEIFFVLPNHRVASDFHHALRAWAHAFQECATDPNSSPPSLLLQLQRNNSIIL